MLFVRSGVEHIYRALLTRDVYLKRTAADMNKQERRAHEQKIADVVKTELSNWLSQPTVQHSLNVRVDLTLKQRRNTDLVTSRPASTPTARYNKTPHWAEAFVAAVNA